MKRDCFLCGGEAETLRLTRWNLPHLASQDIGFGLCTCCGLGQQTESVTPEEMTRYYRESAVYTNPGRAGRPTAGKVRGVESALAMVADGLGRAARSVFQVGSSDGYTLSRFREAGANEVGGVEPSEASCRLARETYGIETLVGNAEDVEFPGDVELWVLTHVLEHIYDPLTLMRRIREAQGTPEGEAPARWVLVEVPLLEQVHRLPPSYLTFEHLSYFSEASLLHLLGRAGYEAEQIQKSYSEDLYPIIRVLARATQTATVGCTPGAHEVATTRDHLELHLARERASWAAVEAVVHRELPPGTPIWLFGAGIHSSQLLAHTDLESYGVLQGLLDSSPIRHGQTFGSYRIHDPAEVELGPGAAIVISSHAAQTEIWNALEPKRRAGVRVVRLYDRPADAGAEHLQAQEVA